VGLDSREDVDEDDIPQRFCAAVQGEFGPDLILLIHHGSRASGDHKPDSDYDLIVGLKTVGSDQLLRLRELLRSSGSFEKVQCFVVSELDLEQFICTHRHQLHFARKLLYGDVPFGPPTKEQEVEEIRRHCDEVGHAARHYLLFPHTPEHIYSRCRMFSKMALVCLRVWVSLKKGVYPATKDELRAALSDPVDLEILDIVEDYDALEGKVRKHPDWLPLLLHEFSQRLLGKLSEYLSENADGDPAG
jgi:hypothetical protein